LSGGVAPVIAGLSSASRSLSPRVAAASSRTSSTHAPHPPREAIALDRLQQVVERRDFERLHGILSYAWTNTIAGEPARVT